MQNEQRPQGSICEVFRVFLILGLTSFGGPSAHLGYFRNEFVQRRNWLTDQAYAELVALCQFLPGPASSQAGFAIGMFRAGVPGGIAAWIAFTMPSAIALFLFASGASELHGPLGQSIFHGLKVSAVAIVAHAVWGMARTLCPDARRASIALAALVTVTMIHGSVGQVCAILMGILLALVLCRSYARTDVAGLKLTVSGMTGSVAAVLFVVLLFGLPLLALAMPSATLSLMDAFYRAGALVFGGGHVVLPLLQAEVVQSGWLDAHEFMAGYGAAQAVPGPLFTFAAYLGALIAPLGSSLSGAFLALVMIFLPGILILLAILPFWGKFRHHHLVQTGMLGANAAVVGILGAALYQPVWVSAIANPLDFALAVAGWLMLAVWKLPAWLVVIVLACGGIGVSVW